MYHSLHICLLYSSIHVLLSLIHIYIKGGKIVSEKAGEIYGTTKLVLSNGVTVYVKPTDFKADQIVMKGVSLSLIHIFAGVDIVIDTPQYPATSHKSPFHDGTATFMEDYLLNTRDQYYMKGGKMCIRDSFRRSCPGSACRLPDSYL